MANLCNLYIMFVNFNYSSFFQVLFIFFLNLPSFILLFFYLSLFTYMNNTHVTVSLII